MGFRISWVASQGIAADELLRTAEKQRTKKRDEIPDLGWYLLELPPWVLLIADGRDDYRDLGRTYAKNLSADGRETLFFRCSDTFMKTDLRCYRDGQEAWSIIYKSDDETKRPELGGEPPEVVHQTLARQQAKQAEDDGADHLYELTAEVGQALTGFRHDTDPETDDPRPFQVLQ
ncbi:hypothetical protein Pan97_00820 [Bremerella volcania]|uniref:Uncharacterized protein n=1 Tax=Bremerella volcania TaxID=2527984 RepID=A0A518C1L7_9BACT|nr:hypothetical protein [Bremerella volcania]QDU73115.1 hypothetical protein Pan97_00820 [Bremerella volcania]